MHSEKDKRKLLQQEKELKLLSSSEKYRRKSTFRK